MNLFITELAKNPSFYFSWVVIVTFSICCHEFAHAYVALRMGDDTAARRGHLSLNPLVQMGRTAIIMLLVIGIAWGRVPVTPARMRSRAGDAITSAAGPLTNLALCIVAALAAALTYGLGARDAESSSPIPLFFFYASMANAVLFLLNMMPVPMFDGWSVFSLLFPAMRTLNPQTRQNITFAVLLLVFLTPAGELLWLFGENAAHFAIKAWYVLLPGI